jgi:L-ascorbate metabolism protein UlaG (beta-lactamase superfamily)
MHTRRTFLATSGAAITLLPFAARADGHDADTFPTSMGNLVVHPIAHASLVLELADGTIYVDPVGDPAAYVGLPAAAMILITHEHGDHFNAETLAALDTGSSIFVANPAVFAMLTQDQQARATSLANGDTMGLGHLTIDAIAAYNITEERLNFHPEGRDNGYVLTYRDFRVYISGDTEDTLEMRGLENIDLAFVCMNLPFTMDVEAAASAVAEFAPTYVYAYHYRGRDNGTQDPTEFAAMLPDGIEAKMGGWYS